MLAFFSLAAGLLAATFALLRIGRPQRAVIAAARQLGQGRLEVRAPVAAGGLSAELGESINVLGRQLLEAHERSRAWMEQETSRLKRELSDERARLSKLEQSASETEAAARSKSELFAHISHELRTPLSAIIGYAGLLQQSSLPAPAAEQVDTLSRSANGLLMMVNDLLDWSRIEAGRLQLNVAPFDLEDCVDDVIALLAPLAYDKGLELVHIVYHDVPRQLVGDAQRVRQILTNLLSNAIKFTERGEVVLRVMKEREEPRQLTLQLRVSDSGPGLTIEQQRQLFQPYRQLVQAGESGASSAQPGSGLGLVITRKLCELMDGSVSLESAPGQGASFSASLVLARQPEPALAQSPDQLRNRSVWLCEPHTTVRLALLHSFEYWGMEVREFSGLNELRDAVARNKLARPDMVVLGVTAVDAEVQAQLTSLGTSGLAVLCLVTSVSQVQYEALRQSGAARCLPKCVGRRQLYETLQELASGAVSESARLDGRCVLVAENNTANRRFIVTLLQGLGAATLEAGDGREAVTRWREQRPDAVLLDIHMPVLDGLAAAREIRAAEAGERKTVIIGISAYLDPAERRALALAGIDDDLQKPFDERQLMRMLKRRLPPMSVAPRPSAVRASAQLAQDTEMLALLREDLPLQLRELEDAYAGTDPQRLREAVHQIHGTAAFYRLAALKKAAATLELQVSQRRDTAAEPKLDEAMRVLREAVTATLSDLA
jgi:two-component system sensor histidine kinase BarA